MRLAPEGRPFIAVALGLAMAGLVLGLRVGGAAWAVTILLGVLAGWTVAFFRDPVREGPRGDELVLAPADGRVVGVAEVDEPMYLQGSATRISIFLSIFDVHVNRHPVTGVVELYHYHAGKFFHAATEKASLENEQASLGLRTSHGKVLVRQIAGLVARRIVTDDREHATVQQGERLGMIRFGSRLDVFLPAGRAAVAVVLGDRARSGVTVLARWRA